MRLHPPSWRVYDAAMNTNLEKHLLPHEHAALADFRSEREKNVKDARYYAGQIKLIMDRARARARKDKACG